MLDTIHANHLEQLLEFCNFNGSRRDTSDIIDKQNEIFVY